MNARALRRIFLPVGMAAVVSASVFGLTGISSAAGSPQPPKPAVVSKVSAEFIVKNKAGTTVRREAGVAKIVRLRLAAPDGVGGPSTVCLAHVWSDFSALPGGTVLEEFEFPSSPFVVGSMFNETIFNQYALESGFQSGADVFVSAANNSSTSRILAGYYCVLFYPINGEC
jgi:hypothetical protein